MATGRTRRSGELQNLDSLLDTMANVTGILVVMLAVTQISMGDAMGRLREMLAQRPELTPESLALAEEEAAALRVELAPLVAAQDDLEGRRRAGRDEVVALRGENARLRREVESARDADPDALRARIRSAAARAGRLERSLSGARAELSGLEERVADLESRPLRREARLPDPRPPPPGATERVVLCRHGRCFPADASGLLARLWDGVERALGRPRQALDLSLLSITDRIRLQSYFERIPVGTGGLRWRITQDAHRQLAAELVWQRDTLGETDTELARPTSDFRRELRRTSPARAYLFFHVWDDSFDAYRTARRLAEEAGFAAGWTARAAGEPVYQYLTRRGAPRFVE